MKIATQLLSVCLLMSLIATEVEARSRYRSVSYRRSYVRSYGGSSFMYYNVGGQSVGTLLEEVIGFLFCLCIVICLRCCGFGGDEETVVIEEEVVIEDDNYNKVPDNTTAYPEGYDASMAPPDQPPTF